MCIEGLRFNQLNTNVYFLHIEEESTSRGLDQQKNEGVKLVDKSTNVKKYYTKNDTNSQMLKLLFLCFAFLRVRDEHIQMGGYINNTSPVIKQIYYWGKKNLDKN